MKIALGFLRYQILLNIHLHIITAVPIIRTFRKRTLIMMMTSSKVWLNIENGNSSEVFGREDGEPAKYLIVRRKLRIMNMPIVLSPSSEYQ